MTLNKTLDGTTLTIKIVGRLDTVTSPKLEEEIESSIGGVSKLVLDFAELEYISSAGLRVLLKTQKAIVKQGEMIIINASETIREVFELTGFIDILTIA